MNLIDINYLINTSLELPKGVFSIKALPYLIASELFKLLKIEDLTIEDIQIFLENEDNWKKLKNKIDPDSSWTYSAFCHCFIYSKYGTKKLNWLQRIISNYQIQEVFKKYSKYELFTILAKLNGLLLFLDNQFNKKQKDAEGEYELKIIHRHIQLFNILKRFGIEELNNQKITFENYLSLITYSQLEVFSRLALIEERNDIATRGFGLSEEGLAKHEKEINDLKKLNSEKGYIRKSTVPIWHGYFKEESLKNPFTEEKEKYLMSRCGENNIVFKQYLKDKEKHTNEFIKAVR